MNLTYIKWIIGFLIFSALCGILYDYIKAKTLISEKEAQITLLSQAIESQNKAISDLELDISNYKKQKPKIVEKIVEKYKTIKVKDESCEAYLYAIYEAQQSFFKRNEYKRIK